MHFRVIWTKRGILYRQKKNLNFLKLLEGKALLRYYIPILIHHFILKEEFIQTWCVYMLSKTAILEVDKVYQKEHEHIRVHASKLEELHWFYLYPYGRIKDWTIYIMSENC